MIVIYFYRYSHVYLILLLMRSQAAQKEAKRKQIFEEYARANGFSPLNAENWYLQSRKKLLNFAVCFNL
jgi:hypothetical protein